MNHFILLSGIIEIFIYHFKPKNVYTFQKFYLIMLALTIFNSICMTNWIDKLGINLFIKQFSKEIFNSSKNPNFRLFFQFYIMTSYIKKENENNYLIYKILRQHSTNCSSESFSVEFKGEYSLSIFIFEYFSKSFFGILVLKILKKINTTK